MLITSSALLFRTKRIIRKLKSVFKRSAAKKADAEPTSPLPTYDALMEARENDEANVCMPKDDIRDEDGFRGIVEDVTDMEDYLSVVEEAATKEEQEEQDEVEEDEEADDIVAHPTPEEMKVVDEAPVKVSSPRFLCGMVQCLGRD